MEEQSSRRRTLPNAKKRIYREQLAELEQRMAESSQQLQALQQQRRRGQLDPAGILCIVLEITLFLALSVYMGGWVGEILWGA